MLHTGLWWQLNTPSFKQLRPSCSVAVEALAGLLEVAVASLCRGESHFGQVLPVEGAAAQLLPLGLGPGPLDGQQLDVAGQGDSPGCQTPGYMPPHCHWPRQTQGGDTVSVDEILGGIQYMIVQQLWIIFVITNLRFIPQRFWTTLNISFRIKMLIFVRPPIDFIHANTCQPSPKPVKWTKNVCQLSMNVNS